MDSSNKVLRRCRRRQQSSPDWASLPSGILDLILNHLIQVVDYLRFSAVCKPWLSAALYQKDRRCRDKKSVPMLLTPPLPPTPGETKKQSVPTRRLYSVTHNKLLNWNELKMMPPPPPPSLGWGRFCGSSYGWLGSVNDDLSITLFNPFSGKSIQLPPAHPRPSVIVHPDPARRRVFDCEKEVDKFVCSCDPSFSNLNDDDDFVVGTIFGSYANFAYYIKPGRGSGHKGGWTYIAGKDFADAVYHRGKFYVVDCYCRVISVDVATSTGEEQPPQVQMVVPPTTTYTKETYILVSSGGGDLLLVQTVFNPVRCKTEGFKIYRLLLNSDHSQFADKVEIDNLGNDALFLGDNHSLCVSASHGCRPNCIYITECRKTNIYCVEDRSFMPLKGIKTRLKRVEYPPPIWIVPTML